MVPIQVALGPLFTTMLSLGLLDSRPGLVLPYLAFGIPYAVFVLYAVHRYDWGPWQVGAVLALIAALSVIWIIQEVISWRGGLRHQAAAGPVETTEADYDYRKAVIGMVLVVGYGWALPLVGFALASVVTREMLEGAAKVEPLDLHNETKDVAALIGAKVMPYALFRTHEKARRFFIRKRAETLPVSASPPKRNVLANNRLDIEFCADFLFCFPVHLVLLYHPVPL